MTKTTAELDYRKLSAELDAILEELQTADLDIDEAVKKYERGMQLVKELEGYLQAAENKVTKIKASFEK
jgi:exodeoxyribonuclease VII small subunit